ncbi:hypothetical protein [Streptomyces sp. NPDC086838]|uniref:hypothetical protein n=1 Tax=Streptomyces sp. NPDC086838 TaxID=3365762 RepID=UPI0038163BB2
MSDLVAAVDGWVVQVTAPPGTDAAGVPGGGAVIGWVLVADEAAAGGARVEPVFVSASRAWTPDQYRATYGQELGVVVGRGR